MKGKTSVRIHRTNSYDTSKLVQKKRHSEKTFYESKLMCLMAIVVLNSCSMPIVVLLIFIGVLGLLKAAHFAYDKVLDIDNPLFCPSDGAKFDFKNSTKAEELMKICVACPEHGKCDSHGSLKCDDGYARSSRQCVENKAFNDKVRTFSDKIYVQYLYHLGNVH